MDCNIKYVKFSITQQYAYDMKRITIEALVNQEINDPIGAKTLGDNTPDVMCITGLKITEEPGITNPVGTNDNFQDVHYLYWPIYMNVEYEGEQAMVQLIDVHNKKYGFSLDASSLSKAQLKALIDSLAPSGSGSVNVDGVTITGAGTVGDPFVAAGDDWGSQVASTTEGVSGAGTVGDPIQLDVDSLTELVTPDAANDFLVIYDTDASEHKKIKPENVGGSDILEYDAGDGLIVKAAKAGITASLAAGVFTIALPADAGLIGFNYQGVSADASFSGGVLADALKFRLTNYPGAADRSDVRPPVVQIYNTTPEADPLAPRDANPYFLATPYSGTQVGITEADSNVLELVVNNIGSSFPNFIVVAQF
jgi:hypothetical protein